jgi:hypothetical protein
MVSSMSGWDAERRRAKSVIGMMWPLAKYGIKNTRHFFLFTLFELIRYSFDESIDINKAVLKEGELGKKRWVLLLIYEAAQIPNSYIIMAESMLSRDCQDGLHRKINFKLSVNGYLNLNHLKFQSDQSILHWTLKLTSFFY